MVVNKPSDADVVIAFKLVTNLESAFFGTACTSDATWEIRKPTGKLLAVGKAKGQAQVPSMGAGGNNCEISFLEAMGNAFNDAMNKL